MSKIRYSSGFWPEFRDRGSGKTHLLCALGQELIRQLERPVYFSPCSLLVQELLVQELLVGKRDLKLSRVLKRLSKFDVVIRAAVLRDDLSDHERDIIEQRLHATLKSLAGQEYVTLDDLLRATQLLNVIKRPVVPDQYRATIHGLLRKFHSTAGGGFELAGGFRTYRNSPASMPGAPDGLDLNWVRSFLRPSRYADRKWIAAVTLDRLNQLANVSQPTWLEYLYYERTLLAAAILVGLCLFATFSSPIPNIPNNIAVASRDLK
jgi:hypothetical protein